MRFSFAQTITRVGAAVGFAGFMALGSLAGCDNASSVDGAETADAALAPFTDAAGFVDVEARAATLADITLSGTITADQTLTNDNTYLLDGVVQVDNNAVLTIQHGTVIRGSTNQPSALLIRQGAKIEAVGTPQQPIVFTSDKPAGQRAPGDWGGVVIIGRSVCNGLATNDCNVEGFPSPLDDLTYGGNPVDVLDDSGRLSYVRFQFAGFDLEPGRELNALTLYSVGRGTEIDHIQVHKGSDDGLELFGGTVDVKFALATGNQDDSFDYSYGWQGRGQFWIAQQDEAIGDRGIEADNNEIQNGSTDFNNQPRTSPTIYNYTLVGRFPSGVGADNNGIVLRRGVAGQLRNGIAVGFGGFALDVDDVETFAQCPGDANSDFLRAAHVIANRSGLGPTSTDPDNEAQCADEATASNGNPNLTNGFDRSNPDFRPRAAIARAARIVDENPPADGFFTTPVNYVGGIDPSSTAGNAWYAGWTRYPQN